ncbi:unnamed protein product [Clonostachys byssicola]|uniref:Aminoglycoside phosphotransferase domain-containing protein n=1 Tax=Clonostachys byssicola TaxID=160290 RepID=A0A9N9Y394_9HYPO|nr:unnamed protein product [Clonostachys byssicola]
MSEAALYDILFIDRSQNCPTPLPTPNDIDGSEVLPNRLSSARLVRIQQRFVMKFGADVRPIEAQNMLYVAKSTTVPVPKVYAIYQRREKQSTVTYILMQYVQGTTLMDLWGSLDQARKTSIAKTLRTYFDQLRQLEHPGFFRQHQRRTATRRYIFGDTGCQRDQGIVCYRGRADGLDHLNVLLEIGERAAHKTQYYQHVLPTVLRSDGTPIFTHNDFQRKNAIVQDDGVLRIETILCKYKQYPAYTNNRIHSIGVAYVTSLT